MLVRFRDFGLGKDAYHSLKRYAGREPWREWLISTGWDGMSKPLIDKTSLEELSPDKASMD